MTKYEKLERAARRIGYKLVKIPRKCGECKYLTGCKSSIGIKCEHPTRTFRSDTAAYRMKSEAACKQFEEKEKEI